MQWLPRQKRSRAPAPAVCLLPASCWRQRPRGGIGCVMEGCVLRVLPTMSMPRSAASCCIYKTRVGPL
jgi:hypothetical protein